MANKAKVVFGQVSKWDAADWRSVGNVAEGLLEGDLQAVSLARRRRPYSLPRLTFA